MSKSWGLLWLDQYGCVVDGPVFNEALNNIVARLGGDIEPGSRLLDHHALTTSSGPMVQGPRLHSHRYFGAPSGEPIPLKPAEQGPSTHGNQILPGAHRKTSPHCRDTL